MINRFVRIRFPHVWRWIASHPIWSVVGVVALIAGLVNDWPGFLGTICRIDDLREGCRSLGLGGVPSIAEEQAWVAAQQRQDGRGFRDYLSMYPQGTYAQAAQARLAGCREVLEEFWHTRDDVLPLFVSAGPSAATEAAAREAALPRVRGEAQDTVCGTYRKTQTYELRGVRLDEAGWRCESSTLGWRCGYVGKVVCEVNVRSTTKMEVCNSTKAAPRRAAS